jgi:electron transport complex protein RnfG
MRNILKLGLFLLVVAGIAGFAIAYVNGVTDPVIEQQMLENKLNSFKEVYADVEKVEDNSSKYLSGNSQEIITEVNIAYQNNQPVGVIYMVEPSGYGGKIQLMAGFDIADKKITAIKVLSQSETPGLGAKAKEKFFTDRFKGKTAKVPLRIVKNESVGENQVQAISSATITSEAVASGVNAAQQHFIKNFAK